MKYNEEYIQTLIHLIEWNTDKAWLATFSDLRNDKDLPSGGMGALKDWKPNFEAVYEQAWYGLLYALLKDWYLPKAKKSHYDYFNQSRFPNSDKYYKEIKYTISLLESELLDNPNQIIISRCSKCKNQSISKYQFEMFVSKNTFITKYNGEGSQLINLLIPENGYNSKFANELRQKLIDVLSKQSIGLVDEVTSCLACNHRDGEEIMLIVAL